MAIQSHRDLLVWQKSMDLVTSVYAISRSFPREETYGLTSQLRRAAVSVPANIAEGHSRATRRDYAHFISIAKGSMMETETLLQIAVRLRYVGESQVLGPLEQIVEVSKMLTALRSRLLE